MDTGMESHHEYGVMAIIMEFQKRRRRQLLVLIPAVLAIALGIAAKNTDLLDQVGIPMNTFGPVFFGFIVLLVGFSFYNWRCPSCKKYLGREISPRFCHRCGVQFRL
jgi:hypothetical protein